MKSEQKAPQGKSAGKEESWLDTIKTLGWAVGIALVVRTFFFEPFNIPSGSMIPTLLIGDYMFVNKMSYGYSRYSFPFGLVPFDGRILSDEPERGDVAVFRKPNEPDIDYVKRIIGLPGDTVSVRAGVLHINGEPVKRKPVTADSLDMHQDLDLNFSRSNSNGRDKDFQLYIETLPNGVEHLIAETGGDDMPNDDMGVYTVPEGHYFAMGDNRDNSLDSRFRQVGFIPHENLIGKATIFFYSHDETSKLLQPWTWPGGIRYSRLLNSID